MLGKLPGINISGKKFPDNAVNVRKPAFCICQKNKDTDQLPGNREADQRLCFRYIDSTIPLLPISEISSLYPSSVTAQLGLCRTWSETPKTGFLTTRLIWYVYFPHCAQSKKKTRTVRESDYSPAVELSEQKDKLVTATGDTEKQANKVWLNSVYWFTRY